MELLEIPETTTPTPSLSKILENSFGICSIIWKPLVAISIIVLLIDCISLFNTNLPSVSEQTKYFLYAIQLILGLVKHALLLSTIGYLVFSWLNKSYIPSVKEALIWCRPFILPIIVIYLALGIAISFFTVLFIIPGIYVAAALAISPFLLLTDSSYTIGSSLTNSPKIMAGHKWKYFLIILMQFCIFAIPTILVKILAPSLADNIYITFVAMVLGCAAYTYFYVVTVLFFRSVLQTPKQVPLQK